MRAQEFITEYRRDKTAQLLGDKLISALVNTKVSSVPDSLYDWRTLAGMAYHPDQYYARDLSVVLNGKRTTISPTNAATVLDQLKPELVDAILNEIEARDPTTNKQYTQWLARVWANANGTVKMEDLNRGQFEGGLLSAYTRAKRRRLIAPEHADINRFKSYTDFENAMLDQYDWDEIEKVDTQEIKGTSKEVYRDADVRVIMPEDEQAACYYGQGTRWCTASTSGNMFRRYHDAGPLYILLPQKPYEPKEKYQLQFTSKQFMDASDSPVRLGDIFSRFPGFKTWAIENVTEVKALLEFAPDSVIAGLAAAIGDYMVDTAHNMLTDWLEDDKESSDEFIKTVEDIAQMTPDEIRWAATEFADPDENGSPSISDLPYVFSMLLEDRIPNNNGLANDVRNNIWVGKWYPSYGGKKLATVDEWTVGVRV